MTACIPTNRTFPIDTEQSEIVTKSNFYFGILISIYTPLMIIINILLMLTILVFKHFQTFQNYLLLSLISADLLVSLITCPIYADVFIKGPGSSIETNRTSCLFKSVIVVLSCGASLLNLDAMVLERYLAICHPLVHFKWKTTRNAIIMASICWVYMIIVSLLPVFGWNRYHERYNCNFYRIMSIGWVIFAVYVTIGLSVLVSMIMYIRLIWAIRASRKRMLARSRSNDEIEQNIKSTEFTVLKFLIWIFLWLPYFVAGILKYTEHAGDTVEIIKNSSLVLAFSNSFINPLVQALKEYFRKAFYLLITTPITRWSEIRYHSFTEQKMEAARVRSSADRLDAPV